MNGINRDSEKISQRLVVKTLICRPQTASCPSFGKEAIQCTWLFLPSWFLAELSSDKPCGVHVKSISLTGFGQSSAN